MLQGEKVISAKVPALVCQLRCMQHTENSAGYNYCLCRHYDDEMSCRGIMGLPAGLRPNECCHPAIMKADSKVHKLLRMIVHAL